MTILRKRELRYGLSQQGCGACQQADQEEHAGIYLAVFSELFSVRLFARGP